MNPAARLSVALLLGLALWLPSLSASMSGQIDLPSAALRFLVAFLFARVAVAGVARLLDAYTAVPEAEDESIPTSDAPGSEEPRRGAQVVGPTT